MDYTPEQIASSNDLLQKGNTLGTAASQQTGVPFTPTSTITSSNLNPTPTLQYQTPDYPPHYPVASLPSLAPMGPTAPEQRANDISTSVQGLNTQLAGKAADTNALYQQLGFKTMTDANGNIVGDAGTTDLQTKLTSLQNEALAIPNQLQLDATGRGITTGGLQPIQTAALRNNSIAALGVSTLIAAKNGQLTTAEHYINAALTQKYGPIEAQLKAQMANLDLIKNSPDYTLADKNRAQQQQDILNQRASQLEMDKTNYTNTQNEILKYAGIADAGMLAQMQKATSPAQVAQIAAQSGIHLPTAGRYQDKTSTLTDAFGNQYQTTKIFDTVTGQFVDAPQGTSASQLNAQNNGSTEPNSGVSGKSSGLNFQQYGLLSKTDFNPSNTVDTLAQKYLDTYIKNGTVPTAATLGRGIKPGAMAQIDQRARDLYFKATGQPLPNPEIIKGYQKQLIGNNQLLNNLNVQEGTIGKNAELLLQNLTTNDINTSAPALNGFIDDVRNMLGDENVAAFLAQHSTVSNELGSLLALKNAQGTTVHDKLTAAGLIGANATAGQTKTVIDKLLQEAVNAHDAINSANKDLYKQTDPLLQDANNPGRAQQQVGQLLDKAGYNYSSLIAEMQPQAPAGHQPAIDAKTGQPFFATPEEIRSGKYLAL